MIFKTVETIHRFIFNGSHKVHNVCKALTNLRIVLLSYLKQVLLLELVSFCPLVVGILLLIITFVFKLLPFFDRVSS